MKSLTKHPNAFFKFGHLLFVLAGIAQCFVEQDALADRSVAPTDSLGDWAIDTKLRCCGPWQKDYAYFTEKGTPAVRELSASRMEFQVRVWPVQGLFLGVESAAGSLGDDESRRWGKREMRSQGAFADLVVEGGYRVRLTPSIIVGGSTHVSLATGSGWATRNRNDVEARALLGFSFTPRWDFFVEPLFGLRTSSELSSSGYRAGWLSGFSYQRERFSLVFYGGNLWHRDSNTSNYTSGLGGATVGWEVSAGLNLTFGIDADNDTNGVILEALGRDRTQTEIVGGLALHWVFYPGDRRNVLRMPNPGRGADWKWWNPGSSRQSLSGL